MDNNVSQFPQQETSAAQSPILSSPPNELYKSSILRSTLIGPQASIEDAKGEGIYSKPLPLQREISEPSPYPFDALGLVLGEAARRIYSVVQAPDGICAQSILSVASLCTQPFANVFCDGRRYPLSLYLLSIADSGERKSGSDEIALAPIRAWQKQLVEVFNKEKKDYRCRRDIWKREYDTIIGKPEKEREIALELLGDEPTPPREPLIICNEPTFEGLTKYLERGQLSFGIFSDEGGRVLTGHSMRENAGNMVGGLSQMWDGRPIDRIRVKDGATVLYGRRIAIHLLMQPVFLMQAKKNQILCEQGLLARFLTVYPKSKAGNRVYQEIDLSNDVAIQGFYDTVNSFLDRKLPMPSERADELAPRDIILTSKAKKLWVDYNDSTDRLMSDSGRYKAIKAMASKAPNQVLRIAGILTLIRDPDAAEVIAQELEAAIVLVNYYLEEALRIDGVSNIEPRLALAEQLLDWLVRKGRVRFNLADVYRNGPSAIRTADKARETLLLLQAHNHVLLNGDGWMLNPVYKTSGA